MNNKNNPFANAKSTWRKHVKNGEIPTWLIDRWVSIGHEDPRKVYRLMSVADVAFLAIALVCITLAMSVINTAMSQFNTGIANMIAPFMIGGVFIAVAVGYLFIRNEFSRTMFKKTRRFEEMLNDLIYIPRPKLTPADLVDTLTLFGAVESALTDLAARRIVFLEYEKNTVGIRHELSYRAYDGLSKLLDLGKELRILPEYETFTKFFAQASATRVGYIQREFDQMLAGLKPDEQPPLYW